MEFTKALDEPTSHNALRIVARMADVNALFASGSPLARADSCIPIMY